MLICFALRNLFLIKDGGLEGELCEYIYEYRSQSGMTSLPFGDESA